MAKKLSGYYNRTIYTGVPCGYKRERPHKAIAKVTRRVVMADPGCTGFVYCSAGRIISAVMCPTPARVNAVERTISRFVEKKWGTRVRSR